MMDPGLSDFVPAPIQWSERWSSDSSARVLRCDGTDGRWVLADEVDARTRDVAAHLASRGVGIGDRVVWQSDPDLDAVLCALGVLRRGAVLVPVAVAQSATERGVVIDDVTPSLVVAPRDRWLAASSTLSCEPASLTGTAPADDQIATELDPSSLALIIYTSGTTGRPKGAMLSHANVAAGIGALLAAWELSPEDRLVSALPLFHVHGLVVALLGLVTAGGSVDLHPRFDVESFSASAAEEEASLAFCVPTMLHRLARAGDLRQLGGLRLLVSGSAPLSVDLFEEVQIRSGQTILERYGMTETMLTFSNPLHGERRPGTVGLALPGVLAQVPAPGAPAAELLVAGPSIFRGYWRRPEATTEVLREGWMATGDLVRVDDDGYLTICGRSKELIISGGFNVYPSEVEDVIRGRRGIVDVAVIGRPSAEWGEEVVAFVVTADGEGVDAPSLRAELAEVLSAYKVPRTFIVLDELPRNALGKLQRHLL